MGMDIAETPKEEPAPVPDKRPTDPSLASAAHA